MFARNCLAAVVVCFALAASAQAETTPDTGVAQRPASKRQKSSHEKRSTARRKKKPKKKDGATPAPKSDAGQTASSGPQSGAAAPTITSAPETANTAAAGRVGIEASPTAPIASTGSDAKAADETLRKEPEVPRTVQPAASEADRKEPQAPPTTAGSEKGPEATAQSTTAGSEKAPETPTTTEPTGVFVPGSVAAALPETTSGAAAAPGTSAASGEPAPLDAPKAEPASFIKPSVPVTPRSRDRVAVVQDADSPTRFGVQVDAGFPGAGGVMMLYRPAWWARLNAGLAYDVIGFGVRGGVTLAPGHFAVTPTLSIDAGRYFSGDANKFVSVNDSNPAVAAAEKTLLSDATYGFASAQVGLEFGSQRWFAFYLRGGLAYLTTTANGARISAIANSKISDSGTTYKLGDAKFSSILPTFSLGFLFFVH